MLKEFKEFALKGNLVDLAIGFIIGVAFSGLVQSLVNDIIMPIIGAVTGGIDFSNLYVQLAGEPKATLEEARKAGATITTGARVRALRLGDAGITAGAIVGEMRTTFSAKAAVIAVITAAMAATQRSGAAPQR